MALSADGVAARIKAELLTDFRLHTILRLPNGVFAPYTDIPSNIIFFERGGPTRDIWYYELPLPEGRRGYTKTMPLRYEEFADCLGWWGARAESERAWRVDAETIIRRDAGGAILGCNLDVKNPHAAEAVAHLAPAELLARLTARENEVAALLGEIAELVKT